MYDTSVESCVQGLYFFFLYLRTLSNLSGCYDSITENTVDFVLLNVSFQQVRNIGAMFDISCTIKAQVIKTPQTAWLHLNRINEI